MQRTPPSTETMKYASNPDIHSSADTGETDCFVHLRKRKQPESEIVQIVEQKLNEQLDVFKNQLEITISNTIKNAVSTALDSEMKKLNSSIIDSLKTINVRLDEIEKSLSYSGERQDSFDCRLKTVEEKSLSNSSLTYQIAALDNKIEVMEQQARQYNIEIANLPERRDENLINVMEKIGTRYLEGTETGRPVGGGMAAAYWWRCRARSARERASCLPPAPPRPSRLS
ncbi:uncharacterized protein LOC135087315 [Ostrinia nubilalis]|uniref:uncharacterized protein LOC135087315 n=1 Tax=Ostrinia nubilalis TaxID=29057 RepID=UPI0030822614